VAVGFATSLSAQDFHLSGQVYLVREGDTIGLARQWVLLHQVDLSGGAPVDSIRTDEYGIYLLEARHDTSAIYISSVEYLGIAYFSAPVRATEFTSDTASTIFVYDTSTVAPPIALRERHVVVRSPGADGSRAVLELILLENDGDRTRIAPDAEHPVWEHHLPPDAYNVAPGEGDVSPEAVLHRGDTIAVVAPIPPGQKQLILTYALPAGNAAVFPVSQPTARLQLLIEDTGADVSGAGLQALGTERVEALEFARYESLDAGPPGAVSVTFSPRRMAVTDYWWVVLLAAVGAFGSALVVWWRRVAPATVAPDDPDVLAARIALLDDDFERRRATAADGEVTSFENQRAELKARLSAALARREMRR